MKVYVNARRTAGGVDNYLAASPAIYVLDGLKAPRSEPLLRLHRPRSLATWMAVGG